MIFTAKFVSTLFCVSLPTRVDAVIELIEIAALLVVGPLVGVEFGVAAVFNPLLAKLPDAAFRQARGGGSRLLGAVMPFWYLGSLALLIAVAALSRSVFVVGAVALLAARRAADGHHARPDQQPDRPMADGRRRLAGSRRPMGPIALAAGGPAGRALPPPPGDFGALARLSASAGAPKSQGGGAVRAAFWLIGGWRAILGAFHRRPSVTEKSVEGPGFVPAAHAGGRGSCFLRAPAILRRGVRHFSAPSCRSAVNTRTHPRGGMHGQG